MKIISVILLALITSFVIIKGQNRHDTIQERIDNLPNVIDNNEVRQSEIDSLAIQLQKELEKAIELQRLDEQYRQRELDSENKLIQEQKKLIITLLENEVRSNNNR